MQVKRFAYEGKGWVGGGWTTTMSDLGFPWMRGGEAWQEAAWRLSSSVTLKARAFPSFLPGFLPRQLDLFLPLWLGAGQERVSPYHAHAHVE